MKVRRRALPAVSAVVGACLVALLVYGVSHQAASRTLDELVARHRYPPAPQASRRLPVLGAPGMSTLGSLRGKVVLLNFWASWCEPCEQEAPLLERTQRQLERHGGTVLGITYLDASPDSEAFVRRYHITYRNLRDKTGEFAHFYGTDQIPESFLLNRQGRIVAISRGEIGPEFAAHAEALAQST